MMRLKGGCGCARQFEVGWSFESDKQALNQPCAVERMAPMRTKYGVFCAVFLLISLIAAAQTRDPLPVPDLGAYRTLKCDFHMHTVFSDGEVWPTTRVTEAWRDGLDAIAITDHHIYRPHKADVSEDIARPHEIALPLARQLGIILIPAVEFAEGDLHANALFVTDANAFKGLNLADGFALAGKQNAFVFWNHPGWKETPRWFEPMAAAHDARQLHGVELVNGKSFYPEAHPWIGEKKLSILCNSDVHAPIDANYGRRERPLTLVFVERADAEGIRKALEAGRTTAWMGGELWGSETLLRGLWEGAVTLSGSPLTSRRGGLIFRNRSAIAFRPKVVKVPGWLSVRTWEIAEEKTTGFVVSAGASAPAGRTEVNIELEITNLHTGPGSNLRVTLPVTVDLKP
jgi:hypothetical protein